MNGEMIMSILHNKCAGEYSVWINLNIFKFSINLNTIDSIIFNLSI